MVNENMMLVGEGVDPDILMSIGGKFLPLKDHFTVNYDGGRSELENVQGLEMDYTYALKGRLPAWMIPGQPSRSTIAEASKGDSGLVIQEGPGVTEMLPEQKELTSSYLEAYEAVEQMGKSLEGSSSYRGGNVWIGKCMTSMKNIDVCKTLMPPSPTCEE